jgi:hypothetical protein
VADRAQRRDVQEVAAGAHDLREHGAIRAPDAEQVDLDRALELLARHRRHASHELQPGVRDRDVDRAETRDGGLDGAIDRVEIGHVGLEPRGPRPELLGKRREPLGLQPDERHVGTGGVQALRRRGADAARGARHEHRPPGDVEARAAHQATVVAGRSTLRRPV